MVRKWAERTPEGFLFHVKAYSAFTGHGLEASALPKDLQALLPQKEGHLSQREVPEEVVEEVVAAVEGEAICRPTGRRPRAFSPRPRSAPHLPTSTA